MESHGFQCQDGLARLVHRLNRFLKSRRGCGRAQVTVVVYNNSYACWNSCPTDSGDKRGPLSCLHTDANSFGLTGNTGITNIDIVTASVEK
jgi:hypothetical protein